MEQAPGKLPTMISTKAIMFAFFLLGTFLPFIFLILHHYDTNVNGAKDNEDVPLGSGNMFDKIAPYYDVTNKFMAFGMDQSWRKSLVDSLNLQEQDFVLDLATGTGDVAILEGVLAHNVVGIDPSFNMLAIAKRKNAKVLLESTVRFEQGDAQALASIESFSIDKISMSFGIRNVPDRSAALREMARVIKSKEQNKQAVVAVLEFVFPTKGLLAFPARVFIKHVIPSIGYIASLGKGKEYQHLTDSIMQFPSPTEFVELMHAAGLTGCTAQSVFVDVVYLFKCAYPLQE